MPFQTEEPYLAAVHGGQVGWWEMADSSPEVMTEEFEDTGLPDSVREMLRDRT